MDNKIEHFVLKEDGKIYWIEKMPEEPVIVEIVGDGGRSRRARQLRKEYNEALQSAIDNAVEVSNQEEVEKEICDRVRAMVTNHPYPLQCSVEKKFHECQAIQCYFDCFTPNNCLSRMTALVTFSEPEPMKETQEELIELVSLAFHAMGKIRSVPTMSGTRYFPIPQDFAPLSLAFHDKLDDFCGKHRDLVDQITRKIP